MASPEVVQAMHRVAEAAKETSKPKIAIFPDLVCAEDGCGGCWNGPDGCNIQQMARYLIDVYGIRVEQMSPWHVCHFPGDQLVITAKARMIRPYGTASIVSKVFTYAHDQGWWGDSYFLVDPNQHNLNECPEDALAWLITDAGDYLAHLAGHDERKPGESSFAVLEDFFGGEEGAVEVILTCLEGAADPDELRRYAS